MYVFRYTFASDQEKLASSPRAVRGKDSTSKGLFRASATCYGASHQELTCAGTSREGSACREIIFKVAKAFPLQTDMPLRVLRNVRSKCIVKQKRTFY